MRSRGWETPLRVGIGLADGRALMIKAGFSGSGIHDVVYMGQVVNPAAKLAALGRKGGSSWTLTSQGISARTTKSSSGTTGTETSTCPKQR